MTYDTAREFNLDPTVCALNGGEDYELLFTIKSADYDKLKNNTLLTVVGHMTDRLEGCSIISGSGNLHEIKAQGWTAFKN